MFHFTQSNSCQLALFVVRITLGVTFFLHGSQKVLGIFGGPGLKGFSQWLGGYGLTPAWAYLAAFAEFIGGILLIAGAYSEIGVILTGGVMLGAIFIIHGTSKYFVQHNGFEYPFVLLLLLSAILIGGPGAFALYDSGKSLREQIFKKQK